ncbi:MAG TPA: hypothetical protein PK400_06630 [Phycisphaerales bacterium]|nr:hypothetical protein [Phycisphaerales bacterium]HRQ76141.1 hypothetical protein [Phycisphaerales bacterium]
MCAASAAFRARIILLGASNLTRGVSAAIASAQRLLSSPLDVYIAAGHGRSYGMASRILVRELPSILESRLWDALARQERLPTYSLITDVGNDVMYGVPPAQIMQWVETCMNRLQAVSNAVVCAGLPLARLERVRPLQYLVARSVFFPTNRFTLTDSIARAKDVHAGLQALSTKHRTHFVELPQNWYGIDPIHIRRTQFSEAWSTILQPWKGDAASTWQEETTTTAIRRWLTIRTKSPDRWRLLGMQRGRAQPCAVLQNGTRISLY